ncbi:MAG: lipocalin family protein [Bdellovibrionales bacterium]
MSVVLALLLGLCQSTVEIWGEWRYAGFIYEGQRYPLPNQDLFLTFTFKPDGRVRLYWTRFNEDGFCEREATYSLEGDQLHQEVVWVNPDNRPDCSHDPDMTLGRKTSNRYQILGQELHLFLQLDDQDFIYLLEKQTPTSGQ